MWAKDKLHKMISIYEFLDRLKTSAECSTLKMRSCNNEKEVLSAATLKFKLDKEIKENKEMHATFWNQSKAIIRTDKLKTTDEEVKPIDRTEGNKSNLSAEESKSNMTSFFGNFSLAKPKKSATCNKHADTGKFGNCLNEIV